MGRVQECRVHRGADPPPPMGWIRPPLTRGGLNTPPPSRLNSATLEPEIGKRTPESSQETSFNLIKFQNTSHATRQLQISESERLQTAHSDRFKTQMTKSNLDFNLSNSQSNLEAKTFEKDCLPD